MKSIIPILISLFLLLAGHSSASAQKSDHRYNLSTIDGTIETLYASISGEKGVERDLETFRMLFREDAKLMPIGFTQQK